MWKQSRPICKFLKAAKDHFTSAKLTFPYTDLRDIFYKTLDWDLNSHEHLLTVIFFVLQYLPTINIFSLSPFPPLFFLLFSPSASLSPAPTLPGEGGAGSAADVRGGAEEARGGREEASGRDGPQAEAGGGGGEDEREAVLPGQWNRRRRRAAGRRERRGDERGGGEGLGDLGERMRDETLKRGWVYMKIKDCQGRERQGKQWRGGWREREWKNRGKVIIGGGVRMIYT